jgi:hypothetical protein
MMWTARRTIVRSSVGQAGFFFTLQTLTRSASHRVTLAASVAVAFTVGVVTVSAAHPDGEFVVSRLPLPVFAVQTFVVAVLLAGYRHLVRVPSDPRASWVFQLAWSGDDRRYVEGSKRAALALLAAPALLVLLILGAFVFDIPLAIAHSIVGAVIAGLVLSVLFLTYRKVPFATAYSGAGDLKAILPLYSVATLIAALVLAAIERAALASDTGEIALLVALVTAVAAVHLVDAKREALPTSFDFDEAPGGATQRFELSR